MLGWRLRMWKTGAIRPERFCALGGSGLVANDDKSTVRPHVDHPKAGQPRGRPACENGGADYPDLMHLLQPVSQAMAVFSGNTAPGVTARCFKERGRPNSLRVEGGAWRLPSQPNRNAAYSPGIERA